MNGQGTNSLVKSALASYHRIVDGQIESIAELETWLQDRSASDGRFEDIASSVCQLLARNKAQLVEARHTGVWSYSPAYSSWCTITWARTSATTVSITGVGNMPHEGFELYPNNDSDVNSIEKFVRLLASAFVNLATTEGHIARLAELMGRMETSSASASPAETVNNHIRLLGQYNETKDIAQQLIGLIADNRGIPVGSLYQDDQYGVGPND